MAIVYEVLKSYRRLITVKVQLCSPVQPGGSLAMSQPPLPEVTANLDNCNKKQQQPVEQLDIPDPSTQINTYSCSQSFYGIRPTPDSITSGGGSSSGVSTSTTVPVVTTYSSSIDSSLRLFAPLSEMFTISHLWSTLLYLLQVLLAYFLMLAFMLFNFWFCISILIGAAFGHFILAHKTIALQDQNNEDYCH